MHSWHAKSPCCRAKIHHFGSRRHQCSYCKRTWRIRNKRRGRKPRRAHPQSLKAVFLEIGLFHRRFDDRRNLLRRLGCRNIGPDHIRFARHIGPDYGRMRAARLHSRPNQGYCLFVDEISAAVQSVDRRENKDVLARLHDRATIKHIVDCDCGVGRQ